MTCPECGARTKTVNGVIKYHTRPDDLSACSLSRTKPKAAAPTEPKPEPAKKAARKAPAKKA